MNYKLTECIFDALSKLSMLCSTAGVTEETKEIANLQIRNLLELLGPEISKLSIAGDIS